MNEPPRSNRFVFVHGVKVWAFMIVTFAPLSWAAGYLSPWLSFVLHLVYAFVVFFPVIFGVGPIGRRIGRGLNEGAIAQYKAERAALGPSRVPFSQGDVPSGPGGES